MYPNSLEPDMRETLSLWETWPDQVPLAREPLADTSSVWIAAIDQAKRRIDIASFYAISEEGKALEPVLYALERARDRGVQVRFLFDAVFYNMMPDLPDQLERLGYPVRKLDIKAVTEHGGVMHAKYMAVDQTRVLLGSANFDWRSLVHIHELGAQVDNPGLAQAMQAVFDTDWALAGGQSRPPATDLASLYQVVHDGQHHRLRVVANPPDMLPAGIEWELPQLVAAIDGASQQINIQLLSFHTTDRSDNPFPTLADALRRAAGRGVRVSLMVADWNAEPGEIEPLVELGKVHGLSVRLTHVPAHSSGFIAFARVAHSKFMTVDGQLSWIGTSNWGGDYFNNSRNLGMFIEGKALASKLDAVFAGLWDSGLSEAVVPGKAYEAPRFRE